MERDEVALLLLGEHDLVEASEALLDTGEVADVLVREQTGATRLGLVVGELLTRPEHVQLALARGEHRNAIGGVRSAQLDVPRASYAPTASYLPAESDL